MSKDTNIRSADIDLGFLDLNTVNERDLAAVPWIGDELARNLIQHRPYGTMDEVRQVPGVTEDIMDTLIRGGATVGEPAPASRRQG